MATKGNGSRRAYPPEFLEEVSEKGADALRGWLGGQGAPEAVLDVFNELMFLMYLKGAEPETFERAGEKRYDEALVESVHFLVWGIATMEKVGC